jgi:hypothetical protein
MHCFSSQSYTESLSVQILNQYVRINSKSYFSSYVTEHSDQCHLLEPELLQTMEIFSDPYLIFQTIMTLRRESYNNHSPY